jgi:hypothetical protein
MISVGIKMDLEQDHFKIYTDTKKYISFQTLTELNCNPGARS